MAAAAAAESGRDAAPVVSSAGALVEALDRLGAKRISVVAPYMKPLTGLVCDYLEGEGLDVHDALSLEVPDNLAVGRLDPEDLLDHARTVDTKGVDALVLSACVQLPSLPALQRVQDAFGIPVVTASAATVWRTLRAFDREPYAPGAGALLAGS